MEVSVPGRRPTMFVRTPPTFFCTVTRVEFDTKLSP
jgi:hypothetical protein